MTRQYFTLHYQLNHKSRYLIWFTNDVDGVVVDEHGRIPIFRTADELAAYADETSIDLVTEEPVLHNLDIVLKDLKRKRPVRINCNEMLCAWNLLSDIARSLGAEFDADQELTQIVYHRLFWGSNLPAVTPPGEHFTPKWSHDQHKIMRDVLTKGFVHFTSAVSPAPIAPRALKTSTPSPGLATD